MKKYTGRTVWNTISAWVADSSKSAIARPENGLGYVEINGKIYAVVWRNNRWQKALRSEVDDEYRHQCSLWADGGMQMEWSHRERYREIINNAPLE